MKTDLNEYIEQEADNAGVPYSVAKMIFDLLGPDEAYDGFISELEYAAEDFDE